MGWLVSTRCPGFVAAHLPHTHLSVPTPILDHKERVIGVCAGRPDDASWGTMQQDAAAELNDARERCRFSRASATHRRGQFPALAVGASFGGGQQVTWPAFLSYRICILIHAS